MLPDLNYINSSKTSLLAVSINDAAMQCRITSDCLDEDAKTDLTNCILSAQAYLESNYSVIFGQCQFKSVYKNNDIPRKIFHLPIANVAEIKSVALASGESKPYDFYKSNTHAYVELECFISDTLTIEYEAGFKTIQDIPQNVRQSVLMLVSYYYDQRNPETSNSVNVSHFAVDALMRPYKKLL